jgi:hypothetical protein
MSFPDLLYRIAHDYPGAVPALAARMYKNQTVLQHKLWPTFGTHHMNAPEIEQLLDFAGANRRAAEYFAHKSGCVLIQLPDVAESDMELLDGYMLIVKELGEFSAEFQRDFADGRIDAREFARIEKEADDVVARLLEMVARIKTLVQP